MTRRPRPWYAVRVSFGADTVELRDSIDLAQLRRLLRHRASRLAYPPFELTRLVAAASEVARAALGRARARVHVGVATYAGKPVLRLTFEAEGLEDDAAVERARRLVDVVVDGTPSVVLTGVPPRPSSS